MDDEKLTIEKVMRTDEDDITLYRLSNGDIVNVDEAVNYERQGMLQGVIIATDQRGKNYMIPTGHTYNSLK